jgi:hypothetical protein
MSHYYKCCTNCTLAEPETLVANGTRPHAKKLVCTECGKFIRWMPKAKINKYSTGRYYGELK